MQIISNLQAIIRSVGARIASMLKDWTPKHILFSIVLLGFIQGVIYMLIIPPWWHYDEPGHFEYAWLAANRPGWPEVGQYDQGMRRQVADSLIEYGWYKIRNFRPDLSGSEPIVIGVPQVGDVPGYYFLASLPLRFMGNAKIIFQYYAVRSISFLLYLLIIAAAWYALGEILSKDHPLRWMVPAFIALLPAFVDTMTAVNNDVSAVLAATLFLWAGLRLIKRGYSAGRLFFLGVTLVVSYLSKNTAWFTFTIAPFVLLFGLLRGRFLKLSIGIIAAGILITSMAALQWGNPLTWYQSPAQASIPRVRSADAPAGNYVFQIGDTGENAPAQFLQFIPPGITKSIRDETVTLGAWIWADQPASMASPYISFLTTKGVFVNSSQTTFELNTKPTFYRLAFRVPPDADKAILYIQYTSQSPSGSVFMDGLVLAAGEYDNTPPRFSDPGGTQGNWNGQVFQNLIRNGSAEQGAFRLRPWVDEMSAGLLSRSGINLSLSLSTIQDWKGTGWYYQSALATLSRTFWASLAGDKVVLPGQYVNYFIGLFTILGLAGAGHLVWSRRKNMRWDIIFILGMSLLVPWMLAASRGVSGFLIQNPLFPWARYAYPAILPTALVLCGGWLEWANLLRKKFQFTNAALSAIFLGGMIGLSAFAMLNAIQAFHKEWLINWGPLALLFLLQWTVFSWARKRQD